MILANELINIELKTIVTKCYVIEPVTAPLFEVMYQNGVRANEAINRALWAFQSGDVVVLTPQKYNDKRIFNLNDLPVNFINYLQNPHLVTFSPNYSRLNYLFNNLSIYPSIYIGRKKSTNHLFRHNYVKKLMASGMESEQIRVHMGERQMKSAMAYIDSVFSTVPTNE